MCKIMDFGNKNAWQPSTALVRCSTDISRELSPTGVDGDSGGLAPLPQGVTQWNEIWMQSYPLVWDFGPTVSHLCEQYMISYRLNGIRVQSCCGSADIRCIYRMGFIMFYHGVYIYIYLSIYLPIYLSIYLSIYINMRTGFKIEIQQGVP